MDRERTPGRFARLEAVGLRASVLECGGPPPLCCTWSSRTPQSKALPMDRECTPKHFAPFGVNMSQFTPQQLEAIAGRGNLLVAAGAGTGKTRTLVARCLRLVAEE